MNLQEERAAKQRELVAEAVKEHHRASLLWTLNEVAEFLEGQSDVRDGAYGEPEPNKAMSLLAHVEEAIADVEKGRV